MQPSVTHRRCLALLAAAVASVTALWYLMPARYRLARQVLQVLPARQVLPVANMSVSVVRSPARLVTANMSLSEVCPPGRFVTIEHTGRLGNKLCQYASLWSRQLDDPTVRPAMILPEMHSALTPLFASLTLPTLPVVCARHSGEFHKISYGIYAKLGPGPPGQPIYLTMHPCDIQRFSRFRASLLEQLTFRPEVLEEAQRRLRNYTAALCHGPPACTYVGVHVRRTDYVAYVKWKFNSTLVGDTYLTRALALCRNRYRRPVFVVSSDDLAWVRQKLRGPDVVIAGSRGPDSAGRDLALLAQCNHTVMTQGTYGFMAAFLAQGDVLVPIGFGGKKGHLTNSASNMRQSGLFNVTGVPIQ